MWFAQAKKNRVENWETYHLTDHRVLDLVDASCKHPKRHRSVEEEVEEHVPSFPADSDYAAETHTLMSDEETVAP